MDSLITQAGEWLGKGWVRVARGQSDQDSMLAREKLITRLQKDVGKLTAEESRLSATIEKFAPPCRKSGGRIQQVQAEVNALHRKRNEVDGQLESRQIQHPLMAGRHEAVGQESTCSSGNR